MLLLMMIVVLPIIAFALCVFSFWSDIKRDWRFYSLLALLTAIFFFKFIFNEVTIIQKDANLLQIPFLQFYKDSILLYHQPPLWNPHFWGAIPNLAHPLFNLFHPTVPLSLLLPSPQALNIIFVLSIFFAASFAFLLIKNVTQSSGVALVSAVVYAFNEFTLDRIGAGTGPGIEYLYSYAMIPLTLALLLRAIKNLDAYYGVLFGFSLAFIMNGNPNFLFYSLLLCFLPTIYYSFSYSPIKFSPYPFAILIIGIVVLFFVNAVEVMPFIEHLQNVDGGRLKTDVSGWRVQGISWAQTANLFLPHLERAYWPYASRVGWIALGLFFLSFLRLRNTGDRKMILLMIVVILTGLLLITHSPLFTVLWDYLPYFRRISTIPAVFVLFTLPLAVLAGIGTKTIISNKWGFVLLALIIYIEVFAFSQLWISNKYSRFPQLRVYKYAEAFADFPHLDYLNNIRSLQPFRIECRGPSYRILCPEYAIMHYRLRLVDGDKYLYPINQIRNNVKNESGFFDVKYILSPTEIDEPGFELMTTMTWLTVIDHKERSLSNAVKDFVQETGWRGDIYIYESSNNKHTLLVDATDQTLQIGDDSSSIQVENYSPMGLDLSGFSSKSGTLIVSEPYYPGWNAKVNGISRKVIELNNGFIGIPIEAGQQTIQLRYIPLSFWLGFGISSITILIVVLWTYSRRNRGGIPIILVKDSSEEDKVNS